MSSARRHGSFASPARASASLIRTTSGSRRSLRTIASVHSAAPATGAFGSERDLGRRALDTARTRGASYADVRFVRREVEDAQVKNGALENVDRVDSLGFGVRAIADGAWGFAASQVTTAAEADRVAALAVEVARASALTKLQDAVLAPAEAQRATFETTVRTDPFAMSVDDRVGLLLAAEAVALLTAKPCPQEINTSVILAGNQLSLQCHESCGHPIELDRALGSEAAFAGTSFLTPDKLGSFRYGSDQINIRIDSTSPGGLGTFGFDDEGVPASEGWAVKDGIFVGYLMSRETAAALGKRSNATMRADDWSRIPMIRMTNVSVMPGTAGTLDDLIADTDDGILMDTNRSWSIDDKRFNFQFGTEIGWEIKKGKRRDMVRNPTYTGLTPEFWGSCDAICSESEWVMWGTPNCGKGQPGQGAHTGHGAAPARFRDVRVGVIK